MKTYAGLFAILDLDSEKLLSAGEIPILFCKQSQARRHLKLLSEQARYEVIEADVVGPQVQEILLSEDD